MTQISRGKCKVEGKSRPRSVLQIAPHQRCCDFNTQGTCGDVWRHPCCHNTGRCSWHPVHRGQGHRSTAHRSTTENLRAPDVKEVRLTNCALHLPTPPLSQLPQIPPCPLPHPQPSSAKNRFHTSIRRDTVPVSRRGKPTPQDVQPLVIIPVPFTSTLVFCCCFFFCKMFRQVLMG